MRSNLIALKKRTHIQEVDPQIPIPSNRVNFINLNSQFQAEGRRQPNLTYSEGKKGSVDTKNLTQRSQDDSFFRGRNDDAQIDRLAQTVRVRNKLVIKANNTYQPVVDWIHQTKSSYRFSSKIKIHKSHHNRKQKVAPYNSECSEAQEINTSFSLYKGEPFVKINCYKATRTAETKAKRNLSELIVMRTKSVQKPEQLPCFNEPPKVYMQKLQKKLRQEYTKMLKKKQVIRETEREEVQVEKSPKKWATQLTPW